MRRRLFPLVLALTAASLPLVLGGGPATAAEADCPLAGTGRTLVTYPAGTDPVARLRATGATEVEAVTAETAVGRLQGRVPGAVATAPERVRRLLAASDDKYAPLQWALDVQHGDQAAARANGGGVVVAVLDSGVEGSHPDLSGHVLSGADATVNPPQPVAAASFTDDVGHGTAVSGIITALRGNKEGIAGMAPGARILPVKVGDDSGVTTSAFIRGMDWAVDHGARVINLSFGGCGADAGEQAAVNRAAARGVLVVAASGNYDVSQPVRPITVYPAAYDNVVAVGATTHGDTQSIYTVTGPFVDLSAPGGSGDGTTSGDIISTLPPFPDDDCPSPCYGVVAGTSFASPYAAAVIALVWGANPNLSPNDVVAIVSATAVDLGPAGRDDTFGQGRVDAAGAVALALSTRGAARVAGVDRYDTAANLSAQAFPEGAPVAYLARGDVFSPDALAAGPAAIAKGGPLLLTEGCALPTRTADELTRLKVATVVVLGGGVAVCDGVLAQIGGLSSHPTVRRVQGGDRFDTAAQLATDTFPNGVGRIFLARGEVFSPDALVGGTAAGTAGSPILLTNQCDLPVTTIQAMDALHATQTVVLGGAGAVCDGIVRQIQSQGRTVTRLAGSDRFETAAVVAASAFPGTTDGVMVARGDVFSPDALAAAPYAAVRGLPLLLSGQCYAPPPTANFVNGRDPASVLIAGGASAICPGIVARFL